MARGIAPVVTTVLLLLIAIAAVGGAWLWYQRMQQSATSKGQAEVVRITQTTGIMYLYINRAYQGADGNLTLDIGNTGQTDVTVTNITVTYEDASGTTHRVGCKDFSTALTIPAGELTTITCTWVPYNNIGSGKTVTIEFESGAMTKKDVVITE